MEDFQLIVPIMLLEDMDGGVPMVNKAGPWLPPAATQTTPYLSTTSFMRSPIRLQGEKERSGDPNIQFGDWKSFVSVRSYLP